MEKYFAYSVDKYDVLSQSQHLRKQRLEDLKFEPSLGKVNETLFNRGWEELGHGSSGRALA
jgi:hypothetical protein